MLGPVGTALRLNSGFGPHPRSLISPSVTYDRRRVRAWAMGRRTRPSASHGQATRRERAERCDAGMRRSNKQMLPVRSGVRLTRVREAVEGTRVEGTAVEGTAAVGTQRADAPPASPPRVADRAASTDLRMAARARAGERADSTCAAAARTAKGTARAAVVQMAVRAAAARAAATEAAAALGEDLEAGGRWQRWRAPSEGKMKARVAALHPVPSGLERSGTQEGAAVVVRTRAVASSASDRRRRRGRLPGRRRRSPYHHRPPLPHRPCRPHASGRPTARACSRCRERPCSRQRHRRPRPPAPRQGARPCCPQPGQTRGGP